MITIGADKIVVGFSRPTKWKPFAWFIMVGFGTNYDHVYIRFHSESSDRDLIFQASKNIVNFMGTKVFETDNIVVKEFEVSITPENRKALMQFAIDNVGKPYSIKEIVGLTIVRIAFWCGKTIENPFKAGTTQYVCSVIADYVLDNFTEDRTPGDFQNATPKMIYEFLETKALATVNLASDVASTDSSKNT